jgi:acyl-CoA synthetase (AMP-forming)/AMP-acid ligase II
MAFPLERRCVHHMLEQRVKEDPDARLLTIIGDSAQSYTRAEVWDLSSRVAGAYRSVGVVPGDRVVIMLENRIEFASAWLGAMAVGAIAAPLNTMFAGPILANMLETMAPAVIVIEAGLVQGVTEALNDAAFSGIVAIVGATEPVDLAGHKTADFDDWLSVAPIEDVHQAIPSDSIADVHLRDDWAVQGLYVAPQPLYDGLRSVGGHRRIPDGRRHSQRHADVPWTSPDVMLYLFHLDRW